MGTLPAVPLMAIRLVVLFGVEEAEEAGTEAEDPGMTGMMGTVLDETWGGEIGVGLWISDDWKELTRLEWKLDNELSDSPIGKSVMFAVRGSKQGSALPALVLSESVSEYKRDRLETALCSPS